MRMGHLMYESREAMPFLGRGATRTRLRSMAMYVPSTTTPGGLELAGVMGGMLDCGLGCGSHVGSTAAACGV